MCRPPTFLYSTRSGPRAPACSHSPAHFCTSPRRSPISAGPGPRSGKLSGGHSWPEAWVASSVPHFLRTISRTSAGRVQAGGATSGHGDGDGGHSGAGEHVRLPPGAVLLDRKGLEPGRTAHWVVDEPDRIDVRLDDVDLLQRRHDQQLEAEPFEQLEGEPGRLVRAAAERLVDDRELERPRLRGAPLELELVRQGRGEDRVGEL